MLILTRKVEEQIFINGEEIKVRILGVQGKNVRLGIEAPRNMSVHREEIYRKIMVDNEQKEEGNK